MKVNTEVEKWEQNHPYIWFVNAKVLPALLLVYAHICSKFKHI